MQEEIKSLEQQSMTSGLAGGVKIGGGSAEDQEFEKAEQALALHFLAEQEKASKFRDKAKI